MYVPYARHYNPRFVYFLPHFSVRFIIKSGLYYRLFKYINIKQGKLGLKSEVYNQERFQIKSGLWWRVYGIHL